MSLKELYSTNADFKRYVDKYCSHYNEGRSIPVSVAFSHKIVQYMADTYKNGK